MSELIGKSKNIKDIKRLIKRATDIQLPVFIFGESGTGKEVIARNIAESANKKFIPVNCGALPRELVEAELFGVKKGAFTGAYSDSKGKVAVSDGGVLFLDEIGELEISMQPKFLRVLQEKEYMPVGSNNILKSDFRLICATNRNLESEVEKGSFREDLFYRIKSGIRINILPLRDRKDDIPMLLDYFLSVYTKKENKNIKGFDKKLVDRLQSLNWKGNVRQLQSFVEQEVVFADEGVEYLTHFPDYLEKEYFLSDDTFNLAENEKRLIKNCLKKVNGNMKKASELLGISRATLYRKLKEYEC